MSFTIRNEATAIAVADPAVEGGFRYPQAEPDKVDIDILVAGILGDGVDNGCAVTAQVVPDMTVAVAAGDVVIGGATVAVAGGNVTISAAHATLPRFDLIVVDNAAANSVILAAVLVPAADTAIETAQIVDKRVVVGAGGGAPIDAKYLVLDVDATLTDEVDVGGTPTDIVPDANVNFQFNSASLRKFIIDNIGAGFSALEFHNFLLEEGSSSYVLDLHQKASTSYADLRMGDLLLIDNASGKGLALRGTGAGYGLIETPAGDGTDIRIDPDSELIDILANFMDIDQRAAPANPAAGTRRLFVDSATGKISVRTSAGVTVSLEDDLKTINFIVDGGGSAITTGQKGHVVVDFACTVQAWTILADQSGSIVIDVWKDTYANFPPTVADTIAGSEKPTLAAAQKNQDTNLTTWTTSIAAGDILAFNVDSATTVTRVTVALKVRVT